MFYTLKRLFAQGKIDEQCLSNAVTKGWITEAEKQMILATPQI